MQFIYAKPINANQFLATISGLMLWLCYWYAMKLAQ